MNLREPEMGPTAVILPLQGGWAYSQFSLGQSQDMERNGVLVTWFEPQIKLPLNIFATWWKKKNPFAQATWWLGFSSIWNIE